MSEYGYTPPPTEFKKAPERTEVGEILRDTFDLLKVEGKKLVGSLEPAPEDEAFQNDLDGQEHHQPNWHQWGVVTHTEKVLEMLENEATGYIEEWGIKGELDTYMDQKLDPSGNYSKWDLFRMSIPPHDLGKFASKMSAEDPGLRDHKGHEKISGEQVADRQGAFWKYYESKGLTNTEIEYIATLAGKHFDLGKIRSKAKQRPEGYSIAYATGPDFTADAKGMLESDSNLAVELGLWFLVDNMGKSDVVIQANTDKEIESKKDEARRLVEQKMETGEVKDPRLVRAVLQRPVNIAMAKRLLTDLLT